MIWSNAKRESEIYIIYKNGNEECEMEYEEEVCRIRFKQKIKENKLRERKKKEGK